MNTSAPPRDQVRAKKVTQTTEPPMDRPSEPTDMMKFSAGSDIQRLDDGSMIERLSDALVENSGRLLLIHGYLNNAEIRAAYDPMITEARAAGWRGEIYGAVWDGGNPLAKIKTIAKKIAWSLVPIPGPRPLLIPLRLGYTVYQIRRYWMDACARADQCGQALGRYVCDEPRNDGRPPWTVAAHSLGCRVAFEAMKRASLESPSPVFNHVLLFGGAVSTTSDWNQTQQTVSHRIVNCFSTNDQVLRFFFKLAHWQNPIGRCSISSGDQNICNHDCSEKVPNHFAYHKSLQDVLRVILADELT